MSRRAEPRRRDRVRLQEPRRPGPQGGDRDRSVALVDARGDSLVSLILADDHVAFECRVKSRRLGGGVTATIIQPPTGSSRTRHSRSRTERSGSSATTASTRIRLADDPVRAGRVRRAARYRRLRRRVGGRGLDGRGLVLRLVAGRRRAERDLGRRSPERRDRRLDDPQTELEGRVGPAAWWVDPAAAPLRPDATTIPALIRERECASGQSPEGRVVDPVVFASADAFLVNIWVRIAPGDCPSNRTSRSRSACPSRSATASSSTGARSHRATPRGCRSSQRGHTNPATCPRARPVGRRGATSPCGREVTPAGWSGIVQWWPARTAIPNRSSTWATSCGWMPGRLNGTTPPRRSGSTGRRARCPGSRAGAASSA